jgi:hypothetical protein
MGSPVKSYFLAPNFDIPPPPEGPVALGSIIYNPAAPERSLNRDDPIPIPPASIYTSHKENWKVSQAHLRERSVGVWAQISQLIIGLGGKINFDHNHDSGTVYDCQRLDTQRFQPDNDYIWRSLQNARVQNYIKRAWFGKPVYMITGIKVARGVTAESLESKQYGGTVKVGVDGTPVGVPITVGPKASSSSEHIEAISWGGSSDFVLCYSLSKIRSRKNDGTFTEGVFNKGALYDIDGDREVETGVDGLQDTWEITEMGVDDDEDDANVSTSVTEDK